MARTRQLKPDFFLNEELSSLTPLTRLLFQGLWLLADRDGRLEDRPAKIKAQIFPYHEADVNLMLNTLQPSFISRYEADGGRFVEVRNFRKHQHIHPDEKISVIPKNPGIPGDFKRTPEIMPLASSPSSSSSPSNSSSPKQPGQAPIDLKNLGSLAKRPADFTANDFSGYRLPADFGEKYGGCYVVNVPPDECEFLIKTMAPGPKVKAALQWRINLKKSEAI